VDVRVLAATNIDLDAAVAAGRLRQDLFFRLNVATVTLPPLRSRPGDIAHLAEHFLGLYREKMQRPDLTLAAASLRALAAYSWPGNIRELENVIHNAVLLAVGPAIEPGDLRLARSNHEGPGDTVEEELRALFLKYLGRSETDLYNRVTQLLVATAFEAVQSNQVRAAERLGLSRNAMRTHLAHMGVIAGRPSRRRDGVALDD
jgi:DNA-binding NtrC family response regulator